MTQIYKKLSDYAKENSITYKTAWNRFKKGKIRGAFLDETGHVMIPVTNLPKQFTNVVLYARVSNNDRKESLNEQLKRLEQFAISNGYIIVKSVKEVGSGMNDNRTQLTNILKNDYWDLIIVENKDRLTRFGFNYLKLLLNKQGKDVLVINQQETEKHEILTDLVSIIYSFSARIYGLRKKKNRKQIEEFLAQ